MGKQKKYININNIRTRKVLIEKVEKDNLLFCYCFPDMKKKGNAYETCNEQWREASEISTRYGLERVECLELYPSAKSGSSIGKKLTEILVKAMRGEIKHLYVSDTNYFCKKSKYVSLYIVQLLLINGVAIYTKKDGKIDFFDCRHLPIFEEFDSFVEVIHDLQIKYNIASELNTNNIL